MKSYCNGAGLFTDLIEQPTYKLTPVNLEMEALAKVKGDTFLGEAREDHSKKSMCDYRSFKLKCGHVQDIRIAHYRKDDCFCRKCFNESLHAVAAAQGLVLKNEKVVGKWNRRLYTHKCGHEELYSNDYLKKHKILGCKECKKESIRNNAEYNNIEVIHKNTDNVSYEVLFKTCGHLGRVGYKAIEFGKPLCRECIEERITKDAINCNLTYLNKEPPKIVKTESRSTVYRAYSCNTCGHVDYYGHSAVGLKNVRCDVCYINRLKDEASVECLEYIGLGTGRGKHFYKLPCGCFKNINPYAVKISSWTCHKHDQTYYNRPNNLYLLRITCDDFSWLKLGFARHVDKRFKGYSIPGNATYELLYFKEFGTTYEVMRFEKNLHTLFSTFRLDKLKMKKYMVGTGHTECYPLEYESLILETIEKESNGKKETTE